MSKGSQRRPTDEKRYRINYDKAFRKEYAGPDSDKGKPRTKDQTIETNNSSPSADGKGN